MLLPRGALLNPKRQQSESYQSPGNLFEHGILRYPKAHASLIDMTLNRPSHCCLPPYWGPLEMPLTPDRDLAPSLGLAQSWAPSRTFLLIRPSKPSGREFVSSLMPIPGQREFLP